MKRLFSKITLKNAAKALLVLVAAWFAVHVFSILGLFLVAAYPLFWLIFPQKTVCFMCGVSQEGDKCRFCNEPVEKRAAYPKNLQSAVLNTIPLLLLTALSIGTVALEANVLRRAGILRPEPTVSFTIPDAGQYKIGQAIIMDIKVQGIETPINAVQADIQFDPEYLEVYDVSTKDSFGNIFINKDINNELGYVRLSGGLPNPGYSLPQGNFGSVIFIAKKAGIATVEFLDSSLVLANDGYGNNVIAELPDASYLIQPERMTQEELAEQERVLSSDVLGVTSDDTQLHFYEGPDVPQIDLGNIEAAQTPEQEASILELIHTMDSYILNTLGLE